MHYNFGFKMPHLPQPGIFWKNHQFKFHVPFVLSYCAKFKKTEWIQSYEITPCLGRKWPICLE